MWIGDLSMVVATYYLPIGCGRAVHTCTYMPPIFRCVDDETIMIGEHLALSSEPRERIALR